MTYPQVINELTSGFVGYVIALVVTAALQNVPPPEAGDGKFYRWMYGTCQTIHSNCNKVRDHVDCCKDNK